ncbi:MAG: transposase [Bacteroidota bacterium]
MTFQPRHVAGDLYFVTATVAGWRRLFEEQAFAQIVLDSLTWHRDHRRCKVFAFVIMPHHVHAVIQPMDGQTISGILQSFGSYTAHRILNELRNQNRLDLVRYFHGQALRANSGEEHRIWQKIQAKNIYSAAFLRQKLEYLHNNPVAKGWKLAEERWQYRYSSACYYDRGMPPLIPIDDAGELFG